MDFSTPRHIEAIVHRVRQFVDQQVIPLETELLRTRDDLRMDQLQDSARGSQGGGIVGAHHAVRVGRHGLAYPGNRPRV